MRIFIAGATGAIGTPLLRNLVSKGHTVFGSTRSAASAKIIASLGGNPFLVDALDAKGIQGAISEAMPDVVVEQLTSLPKVNTPKARSESAAQHNRTRLEGGGNVHRAAIKAGAKRYIAQSSAFWCEPGTGLADESTPLAIKVKAPAVSAGARTLLDVESRVLDTAEIEGIILRYGFFYGPSTWYAPDGSTASQVRAGTQPVIGSGKGVWSFVHIDDAAEATVAAIERSTAGRAIYNITDHTPLELSDWLPAYARFLKAPVPPCLTEEEGRSTLGEDAVFYATQLRGASNKRAMCDLGFRPRQLAWAEFVRKRPNPHLI
jgi:2-alkyl-3-oxoalkanoate reductase